jgi:hypothetical protein
MPDLENPKPRRRRYFWLLLLVVPLPLARHWYITAAFLLISLAVTILFLREGRGE